MLAWYLIAIGLAPLGVMPVRAQQSDAAIHTDQQLIGKLNELTRRKGYKTQPLGVVTCKNLRVAPVGDCVVYQTPYDDPDKVHAHAFNTYDEPGTGTVHIMVQKTDKKMFSIIYLIDLNARLIRAVQRQGNIWTRLRNNKAMAGLAEELSYWRKQITELENEPDRKD